MPRKSTTRAKRAEEDRLDRVFRALSDKTRRALIARLGDSPANISELAEPFAMSLPAVSKHVRVLEQAGLVTRSVEGRVHVCSLEPARLADAEAWLARYRVFWTGALARLAAHVEDDA